MEKDNSFFVDLYFEGKNLKNHDYFSKSDPFVKFLMQTDLDSNMKEIGRTEAIHNTVNPVWKKKLNVEYVFSIKQPVVIEVYDEDGENKFDFMGKAETTLGKIMGTQKKSKEF